MFARRQLPWSRVEQASVDDIIQTSQLRVASGGFAQMAVNAYLKTAGRLNARRKWRSMRARLRRNFTIRR